MGINKFATVEEYNKIVELDAAIRQAQNYTFIKPTYEQIWKEFVKEKNLYFQKAVKESKESTTDTSKSTKWA